MPSMSSKSTVTLNIDLARADTPGVKGKLHFNNAGAALMPRQVLDAVVSHLRLESEIGGYEAAAKAKQAIEHTYDAIATLINCSRAEIAIIENATRAWDMAFYAMRFRPGDRIVTAMSEYASNYIAFLQMKKIAGVEIDVIPNDEFGQLDVDALKRMIDERVKLIAITHVPTNGGLVNPAADVGQIAKSAGIPYLLDACQSIGQIAIDVKRVGCDILTATGRKYLRGPRGTGFLYVDKRILEDLEPPFLDLHAANWISRDDYVMRADARRFENWETNYAGKIGLGTAVEYALHWGLSSIEVRVAMLADSLRQALAKIPDVTVHDQGRTRCGIVTFTVASIPASEVQNRLAERNINVSVSRLNSTRLDMENRGLKDLVRASVHYYNTEEEVEQFCLQLRQVIKESAP
jgi:cysteine desulfurase / selenocysteine lyase